MFFLVYVSSAVRPFSRSDLEDLPATSRDNNAELGITGMLLYRDDNFMQILEGEEGPVRALYDKIGNDPRHRVEITSAKVSRKCGSSPTGRWASASSNPRRSATSPATAST